MVLTDRELAREQDLIRITRSPDGRLTTQDLGPVMFVPPIGQAPAHRVPG